MDRIKDVIKTIWTITSTIIYLGSHSVRWLFRSFTKGISNSATCLSGKTAIITGGNSGIGYATSMLLASRGCRVIIACRRNALKEKDEIIKETNNPNITVKYLDLGRLASVRKFAEEIKNEESKIDILINNAGIGFSQNMMSEDGLDIVMQTNSFGHFLLTHLLIDLLKTSEGSRVIFITSGLSAIHNLSVETLHPWKNPSLKCRIRSYANSKAYNTVVAQEMNKKLAKYGIRVNSVDPGLVRTPIFDSLEGPEIGKVLMRIIFRLGNFICSREPRISAEGIFHVAASRDIEGGLTYFRCAPYVKPRYLENEGLSEEIWNETERIVKLRPEERLERKEQIN